MLDGLVELALLLESSAEILVTAGQRWPRILWFRLLVHQRRHDANRFLELYDGRIEIAAPGQELTPLAIISGQIHLIVEALGVAIDQSLLEETNRLARLQG